MKNNTDTVLALISAMTDYLDQELEPDLDVVERWRDQLESVLASAPPSGEELPPEDRFEQFVQAEIARSPDALRELGNYLADVLDEDRFPRANRLLLQLATEYAPPSAPVGVEGLMQLARNWCLTWGEWAHDADPGGAKEDAAEAALRAALTAALSQQPGAVDDAMPVLTELVATLAATGTVTGGRIYFPERQTRELLKKACDALAAQQQGGAA